MKYTKAETDVITADSFRKLNCNEKRYLLAAHSDQNADRQKYADALIKKIGKGVYNKIREKFLDESYREKILSDYGKRGVTCITVKSADYPDRLRDIPLPPLVLYLRGNVNLLSTRAFAVVGSRRSTPQALAECRKICAELTQNLTVITGVAHGADSAAINGSLESGRIISVLPCGHGGRGAYDLHLMKNVEERGLSVSEYPPETNAAGYTFSMRNRIIAGLADGVLVVSAGKKSGTFSTAGYFADYGKEVFAIPYPPGVASGMGCNALIKSGAFLCDSTEDIYGVLGIECKPAVTVGLDGDEKLIYELLKERGELHAEKIASETGIALTEVLTACSMLEISGLIIRVGGNAFSII